MLKQLITIQHNRAQARELPSQHRVQHGTESEAVWCHSPALPLQSFGQLIQPLCIILVSLTLKQDV